MGVFLIMLYNEKQDNLKAKLGHKPYPVKGVF